MCKQNLLVLDYKPEQIDSASYDLRLGSEYYMNINSSFDHGGPITIQTLGRELNKSVEIPPNQLIIVRTKENVKMPNNIVGHLSLKFSLLLHGVIMASQSQLDAGYEGPVFALLYNLSGEPVSLSFCAPILRLEFEKLDRPTSQKYNGGLQSDSTLGDAVVRNLTSSLSAMHSIVNTMEKNLHESTARMEEKVNRTKRFGWIGIIGATIGIVGIILTLLGPVQDKSADATSEAKHAQQEVAEIERTNTELRTQIDSLIVQLNTLKVELGKG